MSTNSSDGYWSKVSDGWDARVHLKWRARIYSGATPSRENDDYWSFGSVPWIGSGAVGQGVVTEPTALITDLAIRETSTKFMRRGALIIALAGQGKTKGTVAELGIDCYGNQSLSCIDPATDDERFLYWWLTSLYRHIRGLASDDSRDGLNQEMVGSIPVPIVPLLTQRAIAAYLDRETERIDGLIAEKERMLGLLDEKRTALISQAVTQGIDSEVKRRQSGEPWLGQVPLHWQVVRAKAMFREVDERTSTGEETLLSLRMGKGLVPHNEVSEKPLEPSDVVGFKKVATGQMVINRMRAASGLIAVAEQSGLVSPDYAVFDVLKQGLCIEYFLELFKTPLLQAVFRSSSKGLGTGEQGFLRLYSDAFLSLHFPYPPVPEQKAIVEFIAAESKESERTEDLLMRSISLAKERRSALISAAVTGQIPQEEMVT